MALSILSIAGNACESESDLGRAEKDSRCAPSGSSHGTIADQAGHQQPGQRNEENAGKAAIGPMLDRFSTLFGGIAFFGGAVAAYTQLGGVALEMRVALLIASTIAALIFTVIWARTGLLNRERADVFASPSTVPPNAWSPRVLTLFAVGAAGMMLAFLLLPYHNITIATGRADEGSTWLVEFRAPIAPVEVVWISPTPAPRPDCRPNAVGSQQQPRTQMVNWETATASFQVWDFIRDQRVIFECFEAASASSFSVQTQPAAARALTPAVRKRYIQWIVALNVLAVSLSIVALWLFTGRARWRFSRRE